MANDTFVMSVRQAAELDHAFGRNNWTAEDVKWLSEGDNLAKLLAVRRGAASVAPMPLLKFLGTITLAARTERFLPKNSYVVNTEPGPHVKIGYIDSDLTEWFGEKAEEPTTETTLRQYSLTRPSVFAPAMKEIRDSGFVTKTTPGELFSLLEKQSDGPKSVAGPLRTDGYANLFEMDDKDGVARLVDARWNAGYGGWIVYAYVASLSSQWHAENHVFSSNSRFPLAA